MNTIHSPKEMHELATAWRAKNDLIVFVPTMGALHEGHLSLLREGKKLGTKLILSIFVNPTQFAPTEDLEKYPRPIGSDTDKARELGVDVVFMPNPNAMYGEHYQTFVDVLEVTKNLCGKNRPTHFRGVATVVLKLFNIVSPHISLFGEKDYQQLTTIKRMAVDLNIPVEIKAMPIVRERDGLAMSSRNIYLSQDEHESALSLSRSLDLAKKMVADGEKNTEKIILEIRKLIESEKFTRIDYVDICDLKNLNSLEILDQPARILLAVFVGKTRLIDNCQI